MASQYQEKLRIRPLGAKLDRDLGLTSMDPFCVIKIGEQEKVSHVCEKGGVTPRWEERFEFDPNPQEQNILVSLWDKRTLTGDQEIGSANIPLSRILSNKIFDEWIDIFYKDQKAGSVWLIIDKDEGSSGEGFLNKPKSLGERKRDEGVYGTSQQDIHKPIGKEGKHDEGTSQKDIHKPIGKERQEGTLHNEPQQGMQPGIIGGYAEKEPERHERSEPKAPKVKKSKKDKEGKDITSHNEPQQGTQQPGIIGGYTEKKSETHEKEPKAPKVKKSKKEKQLHESSPQQRYNENPEYFPPRSKPDTHLGTEERNVHRESSPKYVGYESPEIVPAHSQHPEQEKGTSQPVQQKAYSEHPSQEVRSKLPEQKEDYSKYPSQEAHSKLPEQQEAYTKYPGHQEAYPKQETHTNYPEKETRHLEHDIPPTQSEKFSKQPIPLTEGSYHSGVGTEGKQVYEAKPKPIQGVEKVEIGMPSGQERYEDVSQRPKEGYQDQPEGKGIKEKFKVVTEVTEVEYAALKKAAKGEKGIEKEKEKEKGQTGTYSQGTEGKIVKP